MSLQSQSDSNLYLQVITLKNFIHLHLIAEANNVISVIKPVHSNSNLEFKLKIKFKIQNQI